jgi:hypothetical protein
MKTYASIFYRKTPAHDWNLCGRARTSDPAGSADLARQLAHVTRAAPGWQVGIVDGLATDPVLLSNYPIYTGAHIPAHAYTLTHGHITIVAK